MALCHHYERGLRNHLKFPNSRSESEDEKNESLNCIVPQGGQIQEVTLPINSFYWYGETPTHLNCTKSHTGYTAGLCDY